MSAFFFPALRLFTAVRGHGAELNGVPMTGTVPAFFRSRRADRIGPNLLQLLQRGIVWEALLAPTSSCAMSS